MRSTHTKLADHALPRIKRAAKRRFRASVEPLEERQMLADLVGAGFSLYGPVNTMMPGATLSVEFFVENDSPFGIPSPHSVGFYLSKDATIDQSDRLLKSGQFAPFMPAFYSSGPIHDVVTLPPASDPFWRGNGTYTLGMYLDAFNEVDEFDEQNNANQGQSIDSVLLSVTGLTPPPDLVVANVSVSSTTLQRGDRVAMDFDVIDNSGVGTSGRPVSVVVRLSRDASLGGDDRVLQRVELPAFSGSSIHGQADFTLPARGDSAWENAQAGQFLVLEVDPDNTIAEANEDNNRNRGAGQDQVGVNINLVDFDPNTLPVSTHKPGTVLAQFLAAMGPWMADTIKGYQGYAKTAQGRVDFGPTIASLQSMNAQIKQMNAQVQPFLKGKGIPQPFTTTSTLDSTALAMTDRLMLGVLSGSVNGGTVLQQSLGRGVNSKAAQFNPYQAKADLTKYINNVLSKAQKPATQALTFITSVILGIATVKAVYLLDAALVSVPTAAIVTAGLGAFAIAYLMRESGKAANRGDSGTYQEITKVTKSTTTGTMSITFNDNAPKGGGKPITPLSTTTETITKTTIDTRQKGINNQDALLSTFDTWKKPSAQSSPFQGTYSGQYTSDTDLSPTGNQTAKMSITFSKRDPKTGIVSGNGFIDKVIYSNQQEIRREKNPFTFSLSSTSSTFYGEVVFKAGGRHSIGGEVSGKTLTGTMGFSNMRFTLGKQ